MLKLKTMIMGALALALVGCNTPTEPTYAQRMVESHGLGDFF